MRLALAQINPVVGDLDGNRRLILERLEAAMAKGADLVLFPELAVTGYPPEDLLLRPGFVRAAESRVEEIARAARGTTVLVGAPHFDRDLFNACFVLSGGEVKAIYRKRFLPNYGVFDEDRYFAPGRDLVLLEHGGTLVGPTVCEDMWQPGPPATELALAGAQLLVNLSASPFHVLRDREREEMFATRARDNSCFVAFCNAVGGQDELIFDGNSLVLDEQGHVLARAPGFEETLLVADLEPADAVGRRLTDVRRRALARDRGEIPEVPTVHVGSARGARARRCVHRATPRRAGADARCARARPPRLRRQERIRRGRRRRLGRDRLGSDGRAERRVGNSRNEIGQFAKRTPERAVVGHLADARFEPGNEGRADSLPS